MPHHDRVTEVVREASTVFATNVWAIRVALETRKHFHASPTSPAPDLKTVVCAPQVPCGAATRQKIEQSTGVTLHPVSEEQDVRSALGRVESGDADAGLVYVTDVKAAGDKVQGVSFPEATQAVNNYPIAALTSAPQPALAQSFINLVRSDSGTKTLQDAGFGTP